jgi:plasmid stability protein
MASITIRRIDDAFKTRRRVWAAHHGRSMEDEARRILRRALGAGPGEANLTDLAETLFGSAGVDLDVHFPVRPRHRPALEPRSLPTGWAGVRRGRP